MAMLIPRDVFKHILSFKDPTKQVGVKGGIQTDSARAMPRHCDEADYAYFVMTRYEHSTKTSLYIWDTDDIDSNVLPRDWEFIAEPIQEYILLSEPLVERPPSELWLQCDACGPDLELYNVMRGGHGRLYNVLSLLPLPGR